MLRQRLILRAIGLQQITVEVSLVRQRLAEDPQEATVTSGYVRRASRPNTWRQRPADRRGDSPCQLGAVRCQRVRYRAALRV